MLKHGRDSQPADLRVGGLRRVPADPTFAAMTSSRSPEPLGTPEAMATTDIAVIGAGPVGLFAVFELGILGFQCHVIDTLSHVGGQCRALYPEKPIYDIPGFPTILAGELVDRLAEQATPFSPVYHLGQRVEALSGDVDSGFRLTTSAGTSVACRAVVIAAGAGAFGPNRPPLPGIEAYEGRSVHYWVGQPADFEGRRVVIAGGGDSAVDWAISLSRIAASVKVVHRREKFRAQPESVRQLQSLAAQGRVELVVPYQLSGLAGDPASGRLETVEVATLEDERQRLPADDLLALFGLSMNLGPVAEWGLALERGQLAVEASTCQTSVAGIFAIGDVAHYPGKLKLILTGFAEAALAAHAVYPLLHPEQPLHWEYSTTKGVPDAASG